MRRRTPKIVLPVTQRYSNGWGVQWRRGNAHRDTYEVVYRGHYEGGVVVTGEGWKWFRPSRRTWRMRVDFSDTIFATWEEAVTDLARRLRRSKRGREMFDGVQLPAQWSGSVFTRGGGVGGGRTPWAPRPIHPDFETYFASREPAGGTSDD